MQDTDDTISESVMRMSKQGRYKQKAPSYLNTFPPTSTVPLDPRIRAALEKETAASTLPTMLTIDEIRTLMEKREQERPKLNEPVARTDDSAVPGPYGDIPIRIYTPLGNAPHPVLLYFHGGGFVAGSLNTHDDLCRSLCHRVDAVVVSVDYRLSPEYKFPVALEECHTVLNWAADYTARTKGDRRRLAVAGDCAGGNLAAALALYVRDEGGPTLTYQVLICPSVNWVFDTASYHKYSTGYGQTRSEAIFSWNSYLASPMDKANPYAAPLRAKDLSNLPPALIINAYYDPLRDDGEAYAARLDHAGVNVRLTCYLGMNHGFIQDGARLEQADQAIQQIAETLHAAWGIAPRKI